MWWNACCATYASRMFGCFTTLGAPSSLGSSSPTISLISVDLPAPLTPMTATRDAIDTWTDTLFSVFTSRDGYLNDTSVSLMSAFVFDVTPSSMPGSGNEKATLSDSSL